MSRDQVANTAPEPELLDAATEHDEPQALPSVPRFTARDPYRPLEPGARRVDFYAPSYVRGRKGS